ncbi:MAG TPA: DegV family protein, partial [Syntrophomonadaceae bacterium]|nr:DegV family protein [Syntrophomonadaceae bacterium]
MKKPIAQIVDSAGSIPRELLEKYNISEVAFHIHFDQQQYRENININSQELYERMKKQPRQVPKTAVPGISDWIQAFEKKYKDGYQSILVTTIARPLSASAESAVAAASAFMQLHPEINIQVLESNTCA